MRDAHALVQGLKEPTANLNMLRKFQNNQTTVHMELLVSQMFRELKMFRGLNILWLALL